MPRWLRLIRGMIGTGLTFAVGVGGLSALVGSIAMLAGELTVLEGMQMAGKLSVVSFLLGVVFSGVLALSAGGRSFNKLSLKFVTALGASGGLIYWLLIGFGNAFRVWSLASAIGNLVILTMMGAGAAAATFILARRAGHALSSGDEMASLGEGSIEDALARSVIPQASARSAASSSSARRHNSPAS